jgi:hypothetical protein
MEQLRDYEIELLQLVKQGEGQWSWYQIAIRYDGAYRPNMMVTLKALAQRGLLIREVIPDSPHDRWELTHKDRVALEDQNPEQQ